MKAWVSGSSLRVSQNAATIRVGSTPAIRLVRAATSNRSQTASLLHPTTRIFAEGQQRLLREQWQSPYAQSLLLHGHHGPVLQIWGALCEHCLNELGQRGGPDTLDTDANHRGIGSS